MQHINVVSLLCVSLLALSACQKPKSSTNNAIKDLNVIEESNLSDIMLTVGDPNEAVTYFKRTVAGNPKKIEPKRGLAMSLIRAKKTAAAVRAWQDVLAHEDATAADQVEYADALIRNSQWKDAEATLDKVPPTFETFKRYRLEAMIADSNKEWKKADSFYEIAVGLTQAPAGTLNNWGYSKLTRKDFKGAEALFTEAVQYDKKLFTAKNNLVLARSAQRKYDVPLVNITQTERAQLLYTAGLAAVKNGDTTIGKGLFQEAIDTHPQHFPEAVRSLGALSTKISNG
ncbi:MAG: tetratricopeptide repeat protein [Halocynthiibacter sp.]